MLHPKQPRCSTAFKQIDEIATKKMECYRVQKKSSLSETLMKIEEQAVQISYATAF